MGKAEKNHNPSDEHSDPFCPLNALSTASKPATEQHTGVVDNTRLPEILEALTNASLQFHQRSCLFSNPKPKQTHTLDSFPDYERESITSEYSHGLTPGMQSPNSPEGEKQK